MDTEDTEISNLVEYIKPALELDAGEIELKSDVIEPNSSEEPLAPRTEEDELECHNNKAEVDTGTVKACGTENVNPAIEDSNVFEDLEILTESNSNSNEEFFATTKSISVTEDDLEILTTSSEKSPATTIKSATDQKSAVFPVVVLDTFLSSCNTLTQDTRYTLDKLVSVTPDPRSWSNIPSSLPRFQIELCTESQIESVLITKNELYWTNICLLEESYISYQNFPRFASELGPQLQILKLDKFYGSIPEISFISCCLSLKSLTILQMDVRRSPRMLLPSEFPNLNKTFVGVKSFSTVNIYFDKPKQLEFFKNFLNRFPKLEQLNIPQPHGPPEIAWDMLKILQSKYLIKPVVDYLNERHNNMALPINPIKRCVNSGGVFSTIFSELAMACAKNGAFLTNISQKQIENLFLAQDNTLGKILYLNDGITDRRMLVRWANLEKVYLKTSVCDIRSETFRGKAALFPNLKSMHFVFDSDSKTDPGFKSLDLLLELMIGQGRPSVKELSLCWPPFGHDCPEDVVSVKRIVNNLPNLEAFHANNWKAWDDELIVILEGLKKLSRLAIEDCPLFTEFGFLGHDPNNPKILGLTGLKHVEIVNRNGSGSITDDCFTRAFQHIPLKAFVFDVTPNLVTKEGYESLTQGEFSNHIEIFPEPKTLPVGLSKEEFSNLRNIFKQFTLK